MYLLPFLWKGGGTFFISRLMISLFKKTLLLLTIALFGTACGSNTSTPDQENPTVVSTTPVSNATEVGIATEINVTYNEEVKLATSQHGITINGDVASAIATGRVLTLSYTLALGKKHTISIPRNVILDLSGNPASAYTFTFTTTMGASGFKSSSFDITSSLCTSNPSSQAIKVYNFLKENFGKKIISGAMANVNWNIEEAQWMNTNAGKYPALNCFDYIHHQYSPASWIDYSNTTVVENWWADNGLVAISWHWNVPKSQGSTEYGFYTTDTDFDISRATTAGTYENDVIKKDLASIAEHLTLLKNKNIPVIWRPLHEASGKWFWWGAGSAKDYVALWKYMFTFFEEKGLNNLIWVWTSETGDADWYPGDQYVDIIGRDKYPTSNYHSTQIADFNKIIALSGGKKLIALSECGSTPYATSMWTSGDMWSWYMPWYGDHTRADSPNGESFFKEMFACPIVITRDQMPSLK
ncbi:MAG: glycosyl hydrolase [Flavobacteriales bacterium]|nr:glycosyl hydrolase [Flavobacteriales bacterium]